jgi:hypothetical protein
MVTRGAALPISRQATGPTSAGSTSDEEPMQTVAEAWLDEIARVLDTAVATLAASGPLDESERWALSARLTRVRVALEDLRGRSLLLEPNRPLP